MATEADSPFDYDVVVVGGGPTGCSTGVFTARYGLDTAIFDRGRSSLRQCGHLENYLGFPGGIDVETFYALAHAHAEEAGCEIIANLVESVDRRDDGPGFTVETQDGESVTAARVVAAARYDGEFLRGLDDDEVLFDSHEHDGEVREHFNRDYPDADGRTPVDGLYVAAPVDDASHQAITAAGHGAQVGRNVVYDARRDTGYWDGIAAHYDWVRRESTLTGEWADRDRWREWADDRRPDDHDLSEEAYVELREDEIDRRMATYAADEELDRRAERGIDRLLDAIDTDRIRAYLERVEGEEDEGVKGSETQAN